MTTDSSAKVTCPVCGTTVTLDEARNDPRWRCVSTGVLGAVEVEWYCQECYEHAFHCGQRGSDSGSDESTL